MNRRPRPVVDVVTALGVHRIDATVVANRRRVQTPRANWRSMGGPVVGSLAEDDEDDEDNRIEKQ